MKSFDHELLECSGSHQYQVLSEGPRKSLGICTTCNERLQSTKYDFFPCTKHTKVRVENQVPNETSRSCSYRFTWLDARRRGDATTMVQPCSLPLSRLKLACKVSIECKKSSSCVSVSHKGVLGAPMQVDFCLLLLVASRLIVLSQPSLCPSRPTETNKNNHEAFGCLSPSPARW